MPFKHSLMTLCGLSLLFLAGSASADSVIIKTNPVGDKKTLADSISFMAKDLSCAQNEDCKSIGFGDKPCGGFQTYKIYSTKNMDQTEFTRLVKEYNDWEKEENKESGMASTCEMLLEPAVACVQGLCAAVGTAPSAQ